MRHLLMPCLVALLTVLAAVGAEEPARKEKSAAEGEARQASPGLEAALAKLKLPGVKINLEERCVDVDSEVCLRQGALELIACTKDTKEHESIVAIKAKPSHIHTALLLIGATPGNPAMRKPIDEKGMRFIDLPPRGGPVDVSLVIGKDKEIPINEFIIPAEDLGDGPGSPEDPEAGSFPADSFIFAGSILYGDGDGPRRYICDESGNVISISTFGDELLCLPGIHGHANGMLMWEVDGSKLPELGTPVKLRLRPKMRRQSAPDPGASGGRN